MPSTSKKQSNFMKAVANNPKFAKRVGVSQKVGKEFAVADKKMGKYAMGGDAKMERDRQKTGMKIYQVNKKAADKEADILRSTRNYAKGGGIERKGKTKGTMVKMAKGGSIDGIAKKGKTRTAYPKMKHGGSC